jgi:hypothetical protein
MAEGAARVEGVLGAPAVALAAEVASLFEVGDDAQGGAFGDVAAGADAAEKEVGVARDGQ